MPPKELYDCPICGRKHSKNNMTWHHLFPSVGGKERQEPSIYICLTCHSVIHHCHTNQELRETYNSLELILSSEDVKYLLELYKYKADDCVFKVKKLKRKR
jgi:5-methylcytosine-specific restriction enzyme A